MKMREGGFKTVTMLEIARTFMQLEPNNLLHLQRLLGMFSAPYVALCLVWPYL